MEKIKGLDFKVSAFSFFQTNVRAVEKLYDYDIVFNGFCSTGMTGVTQVRRSAHPPARGGGRGPSAEPGVEGFSEGGADLHASQHFAGGDRRAARYVSAHDLAGRQGPDEGLPACR